jgi:DNA-3-methyladenine glycosylase
MEGIHIRELNSRLGSDFFTRDVLDVAPDMIGKILSVRQPDGSILRFAITETEAYRGVADKACHASKGRTARNSIMFCKGGHVYMYLIYGMYWMLNFVTSLENDPQAVLIRGISGTYGPGRLTGKLGLDRSFYGEDASVSERIWVEESLQKVKVQSGPRIGVGYAGTEWAGKSWRFYTTDL